jgi:orotate phosphoribosyltransferase
MKGISETRAEIRALAEKIRALALECGAITSGSYELSSGITSNYYFDGRKLTLDPLGARLMGRAFLAMLTGYDINAVGGPALGADPIVTAVAMTSDVDKRPLNGFIVRKEEKEHGTGQLIEGPTLEPGSRVAIVDDTCTTGGSLWHAIDAAEAKGCQVEVVMVLLDRRQGGSEAFKERGLTFKCLLEADSDGEIHPAKDLDFNTMWNGNPEEREAIWPTANEENGASNWKDGLSAERVSSIRNGRLN